jgi:DNA-binding response OmpR family regulator
MSNGVFTYFPTQPAFDDDESRIRVSVFAHRFSVAFDVRMSRPTILHIEDDPDDAFFVSRAIALLNPECNIRRLADGEAAVKFLKSICETGLQAPPDLVVLDVKLPGVDGFEVLAWARRHGLDLPIIMLSGSALESDRRRAKDLGAAGYVVKSSDYREVAKAVLAFLPQSA